MTKWLSKYLTDEDVKKISEAVHQAEETTTGEIVPVIVRRSSAIRHIPLTLTLILLVILFFIEFPFKDLLFVSPWIYLWPVFAVLFYLLALVLTKHKTIQRIFVPDADEHDQAFQRAQLEFYLNRVSDTQKETGILIFVSVMERKAFILADRGVSEKIAPAVWQELVHELSQKLHKGEWSQGFQDCIRQCGQILTTHFPIQGEVRNELRNDLVIKE